MTRFHHRLLASILLAFALSGVVATESQSDEAVVDLISIDSMCVLPVSSGTIVTSPADMEFLQTELLAMVQRLGYRVLETCVEADPVMETSVALVTKKDYGSWQPGGPTKVEYVVFRFVVRQHSSGEIWAGRFEPVLVSSYIVRAAFCE